MSNKTLAILSGVCIGWGLSALLSARVLESCSEELHECRSGATCEHALAAYAESLELGLYNADEVPQ